jgi:hypothetical protein
LWQQISSFTYQTNADPENVRVTESKRAKHFVWACVLNLLECETLRLFRFRWPEERVSFLRFRAWVQESWGGKVRKTVARVRVDGQDSQFELMNNKRKSTAPHPPNNLGTNLEYEPENDDTGV